MFRAPQWHGAAQTHFPPRPRKSAWHCDITNVIGHAHCPHTIEAIIPRDTANNPAHQRHAAFTPACFALPSGTAPRKRTFHQGHANPRHCDITDVFRHTVCPHTRSNPITQYRQSSRSPATRRVCTSVFGDPQWHGATQTHFQAAQIRVALRHHGRNFASRSAHALQPLISHDTANHPAHQRHAAFYASMFHFPPRPFQSSFCPKKGAGNNAPSSMPDTGNLASVQANHLRRFRLSPSVLASKWPSSARSLLLCHDAS